MNRMNQLIIYIGPLLDYPRPVPVRATDIEIRVDRHIYAPDWTMLETRQETMTDRLTPQELETLRSLLEGCLDRLEADP